MNSVALTGRIANDIIYKETQSGVAFISTSIAVRRDFKNQNGEYDTDFFRINSIGKTAEFINKYIKKGCLVSLLGSLRMNKYQDKNGENRISYEIFVNEIQNYTWEDNKQNDLGA